jgi:hypothetical protein
MGGQGRAAPTDAHDVGRLQILRNVPKNGKRKYDCEIVDPMEVAIIR